MDLKVIYVLSLLYAFAQTKNTERRAVNVLAFVSASVEIANFVYEIVNGNNDQDTASPADLEKAKNEIITVFSEKLAVVQAQLYGSIKETMSLSKIDEVNYKIQSALLDLKSYLLASGNAQSVKKEEFETQAALIIADIRSLPSRLEKSLANADQSLLELMATNSKCNMSGMNEFNDFFFNLTQTGIIIEFSYKTIKQNSTLQTESEWWDSQVRQMIDSFEREDSRCKSRFHTLLRSDMEKHDNLKELSNIVHQKYVWYIIDVFILKQNDDGEDINIEGKETNMMTLSVNGLRKYLIYIDKQTRLNAIKCLLLKSNIQAPLDEVFILDKGTPAHGYVSTTEGSLKKTTFLYDETDETRSCHPETVPVDAVKDRTNEDGGSKEGLNIFLIGGIGLASLVFLAAFISVCYCWYRRRRLWKYI
ncbi:uncharacterized protein LOC128209718 [Mya arenaria]|uniref:uncharacterized protein LOC128209718 n=1 Tax=Mya arenaria TaxID=6604 RepID=UPI0022DF983F|nr:uncharacterized protein LOC128209718 [Mya arenaria]